MSTTGKVLVVLVALATIPWMLLFSMVYELNRNWGQEINKINQDLARAEQSLAKARDDLGTARALVDRTQVNRDNELTVLRTKLSEAEKQMTLLQEQQERTRLELATLTAIEEDAQKDVQRRIQEEEDTKKELADTRATVQTLQADVDARLKELGTMQKTFLDTMSENRAMIERLERAKSESGGARTRPASWRPALAR